MFAWDDFGGLPDSFPHSSGACPGTLYSVKRLLRCLLKGYLTKTACVPAIRDFVLWIKVAPAEQRLRMQIHSKERGRSLP